MQGAASVGRLWEAQKVPPACSQRHTADSRTRSGNFTLTVESLQGREGSVEHSRMSGQPQSTTHPPASSPVWSHSFITPSFLVPVLNSCSPRYSFLTRVLPQVRACLTLLNSRDLWEALAHEGAQKKLSSVPHDPNSSSEKQREACQDLAKLASLSCSPRPRL